MKVQELETLKRRFIQNMLPSTPMILVGMGTCGIGNGADVLYESLQNHITENKLDCRLKPTGCFGFCAAEPLVML